MDEDDGAPAIFSKSTKVRSSPSAEQRSDAPTTAFDSRVVNCETFEGLGLSPWLQKTCQELGLVRPTPVQQGCIPQILEGKDVVAMAETGSGKTAAFALPILQKLAENPYGIFALVMTPTRELAFQISDQFKALGAPMSLRCAVVVGGMDMTSQAQALMNRPHVVIATPGRIKSHLLNGEDMAGCFSRAQFLVLDEADRLLEVGFEDEMRVVLQKLPGSRKTLLFSATMTSNLQAVLDLSLGKTFFFNADQGMKTVTPLKQQYIFLPVNVKDLYLLHILSNLEEQSIRSVIIFAGKCRTCHLLYLILKELEIEALALHSMQAQRLRLASLSRFKSGQVPILVATDVASRGLDIPTVDLVINYDFPRLTQDYVHRVGRTARAGRGGSAVSLVTQYDVELVQGTESTLGITLEEYETVESVVLKGITQVFKAKRVAALKLLESGFEDKVKARKDLKIKSLSEAGRIDLKKMKHRRKRRREEGKEHGLTEVET